MTGLVEDIGLSSPVPPIVVASNDTRSGGNHVVVSTTNPPSVLWNCMFHLQSCALSMK